MYVRKLALHILNAVNLYLVFSNHGLTRYDAGKSLDVNDNSKQSKFCRFNGDY